MPARVRALCFVLIATLSCATAIRAQVPGPSMRPAPPAPVQPLPYSHRQHIEIGLDCRDCHVNPDAGKLMTYPANDTCLSCHRAMPAVTPVSQQLRTLAASPTPIPWVRVYRVAEYVYWEHGPHLAAGVQCIECHGPVAERDIIAEETNIVTMQGCVTCHEKRRVLMDCGDCHEPRQ